MWQRVQRVGHSTQTITGAAQPTVYPRALSPQAQSVLSCRKHTHTNHSVLPCHHKHTGGTAQVYRQQGMAPSACGSAGAGQLNLRQLLRPPAVASRSQASSLPDSLSTAPQDVQGHHWYSTQGPDSIKRHAPQRRVLSSTPGALRPFTEAPLVHPGGATTAPPPPSFVDGDLRVPEKGASAGGVSQSGTPEEDWGSDETQSDIIFVGTGTSEGVPRVSCLTNPNKTCPVSGRPPHLRGLTCIDLP